MKPGPGSAAIALCIFISGCITVQDATPRSEAQRQQQWEQIRARNAQMKTWALSGKIGVKTGRRGISATLKWDYVADDQDIELYGPFGGGRVRIEVDGHSAVLRDVKGREIKGKSAEEVLQKRLGWHVPFEALVMWSRGLPNAGATDIEIDLFGRLLSLNQGIWHVEYQEHRNIEGLTLPRKLTITSLPGKMEIFDDNGNYISDELQIKVILKRWWGIESG